MSYEYLGKERQAMTEEKIMKKQGSEVSSVTATTIKPPLCDKYF